MSQGRQGQRKAQQFCRQVQRALNLALADRYEDDGLNELFVDDVTLFVDDVTPAPDRGHLLVHVVVPANRSVADALSSLRQDASRLRSEVAMTISRKRAPELSFVTRRTFSKSRSCLTCTFQPMSASVSSLPRAVKPWSGGVQIVVGCQTAPEKGVCRPALLAHSGAP
jgi:ribosome-binding factor A